MFDAILGCLGLVQAGGSPGEEEEGGESEDDDDDGDDDDDDDEDEWRYNDTKLPIPPDQAHSRPQAAPSWSDRQSPRRPGWWKPEYNFSEESG